MLSSPRFYQTPAEQEAQINLVPPSNFIQINWQQLLPDWSTAPQYLVLILQKTTCSLQDSNQEVLQAKSLHRRIFLRLACRLVFALNEQNYPSDLFDPRSGYPLLGISGISLDDNATVGATLNYPVTRYNQCSLLTHPIWRNSVYPATIITAAPLNTLEKSVDLALQNERWMPLNG